MATNHGISSERDEEIIISFHQQEAEGTTTTAGQLPSVPENRRERPYKYLGYPKLCEYIASDNDGYLFRRFGRLNARVLLNLQHEIETQQKYLEELDAQCARDSNSLALLNSLDWDKHPLNPHPERAEVIERLQPLLHTYNEHLVTYSQLRDRESAPTYQAENVKNWIRNNSNPKEKNSGPIKDEEQQYLDSGIDLICISRQNKTPIARFLEQYSIVRRLFRKRSRHGQVDDLKTTWYSDKKVEWLSNTITVLLGLVMLYGPMWWLNFVADDVKRLGIITIFIFLFALGLSLIGSGRPFETLAATAAYAAVLMVFMQKQTDSAEKS